MSVKARRSVWLIDLLIAISSGAAFAIGALFSGVPKNFYGDDLLLLAGPTGSRSPNGYASSALFGFNDIGSGKWRPAFTTLGALTLRAFGSNYIGYMVVNASLVVVILYTALRLLGAITSVDFLTRVLIGAAFTLSPFSWYSVWSPFGLMELAAIASVMIGLALWFSAPSSRTTSGNWSAASLVLLGACFHERYLIVFAPMVIAVFVMDIPSFRLRFGAPWILAPSAYLATKVFLLHLDPLTGGGETDFRSTDKSWIPKHLLASIRAVFGLGDGRIISFEASGRTRIIQEDLIHKAAFVGISILVSVVILIWLTTWFIPLERSKLARPFADHSTNLKVLILLISSLLLLVPGSTVVSRIEGRWLFGSNIIIIVAVGAFLGSSGKLFRDLSILVMCGFIAMGIFSQRYRSEYEGPMRRTDQLMNIVRSHPQAASPWVLVIRDPGVIGQWEWRLGYGAAFEGLINPPAGIVTDDIPCEGPCLVVDMSDKKWEVTQHLGR